MQEIGLATLLTTRPSLRPGEVVTVVASVARDLASVHARGQVHGAVSASSVVLEPTGRPRLVPAGLASGAHVDPPDDVRALARLADQLVGPYPPQRLVWVLHEAAEGDLSATALATKILTACRPEPVRLGSAAPPPSACSTPSPVRPTSHPDPAGRSVPPTDPAGRPARVVDPAGRPVPPWEPAGRSVSPGESVGRSVPPADGGGGSAADGWSLFVPATGSVPHDVFGSVGPVSGQGQLFGPWARSAGVVRSAPAERVVAAGAHRRLRDGGAGAVLQGVFARGRKRWLATLLIPVMVAGALAVTARVRATPEELPAAAVTTTSAATTASTGKEGTPAAGATATSTAQPSTSDAGSTGAASTAVWRERLERLDRQRAAAYARGDPGRLRTVYLPGATALVDDTAALREYQHAGLRVHGLRLALDHVRVLAVTRSYAELAVTDRLGAYQLVDAAGRVVRTEPGRSDRNWRVVLRVHAEQWRIASVRPA